MNNVAEMTDNQLRMVLEKLREELGEEPHLDPRLEARRLSSIAREAAKIGEELVRRKR